MSNLVQKWYGIEGEEDNWPDNIYGNVLDDGDTTSKISISAPYGTIVQLVSTATPDNPKRILIGPSGIYDFNYSGIDIQEISFPDNSSGGELKEYLDTAIEDLRTILENCDEQNPDYNYFCGAMRNLFIGVTPDNLDSKPLEDIITEWLAQSNMMQGNDNLSNIIVNYISNNEE